MAPYDSDSEEDEVGTQASYMETAVLLGYAEADTTTTADGSGNETVSRLGGRPEWLAAKSPSAALARCGVCQALMVLLLQLNGELPDRFPGHERRLYVFACRNKGCRRKAGSVRAVRGVQVDEAAAVAEAAAAAAKAKAKAKREKAAAEAAAAAPAPMRITGESIFGVTNPFGGFGGSNSGANPFMIGGTEKQNPFSMGGPEAEEDATKKEAPAPAVAAAAAPATLTTAETTTEKVEKVASEELPRTFAAALTLDKDGKAGGKEGAALSGPAPPPEPWPPAESWPAAYPVSWIVSAEYETLDPTPAAAPQQAVQMMDLDEGENGKGKAGGKGDKGGKEDKYVFESSIDSSFQRFADRVSQNPEQVIRYEFGGQPLLYRKDDEIGKLVLSSLAGAVGVTTAGGLPRCVCGARRVFEVQLMPHAIGLLEADELGLEGMDWGTMIVAVCERDCLGRDEPTYLEEWVGVQWEELR